MIVENDPQDVEDVLASIRKLVSDEARARVDEKTKASIDQAFAEESDPMTAEKLVLTPEFKIASRSSQIGSKQQSEPSIIDEDIDLTSAPFHDEIELRKLVSEILREELQGELGHRITRNVRKLIRQEIDVALRDRV